MSEGREGSKGREGTVKAILVVVVLAGCAVESGSGAGVSRVDTLPTGTVVVHNAAQGVWDSASGWQLVEDLRVGSAEGDEAAAFSRIAALAVDASGRIHVLDALAQDVRVFDSAGTHLRTIGRAGDGPGEFRRATGLAMNSTGVLWVVDPGSKRYSLFDTTGRFLESRPRRGTGSAGLTWAGGVAADAVWDSWQLRPSADPTCRQTAYFRFDAVSMYTDSLLLPIFCEASYEFGATGAGGGMRMFAPVPFAPRELVAFDPHGFVWHAVSDTYRITQMSLDGDTMRVITREYRPERVTDDDRSRAIQRLTASMGPNATEPDPSRIPPIKPALLDLVVDDRGYLWALPMGEAGAPDLMLDVFEPGGSYLGKVRTGLRTWTSSPAPVIRGGALYTVQRDSLNVPYVIRYRIEGRN